MGNIGNEIGRLINSGRWLAAYNYGANIYYSAPDADYDVHDLYQIVLAQLLCDKRFWPNGCMMGLINHPDFTSDMHGDLLRDAALAALRGSEDRGWALEWLGAAKMVHESTGNRAKLAADLSARARMFSGHVDKEALRCFRDAQSLFDSINRGSPEWDEQYYLNHCVHYLAFLAQFPRAELKASDRVLKAQLAHTVRAGARRTRNWKKLVAGVILPFGPVGYRLYARLSGRR